MLSEVNITEMTTQARKRSTGNMCLLKIQTRMVITYIKLEELITVLIATEDITEKQDYFKRNCFHIQTKTSFTHSGYLSASDVSSL